MGYLSGGGLNKGAVDVKENRTNLRELSDLWRDISRHRRSGTGYSFSEELMKIFRQLITDGAGCIMI